MSFWKSFKKSSGQVAKKAMPYAKYAMPAILPGLAVSPFIFQALKHKKQADQGKRLQLKTETVRDSGRGRDGGGEDEAFDFDEQVDQVVEGWGDEFEAGMLAGGAEREMLARMRSKRRNVGVSGGVPAEVYRAGVWQRALKMTGGKRPDAKTLMLAQGSVNRDLGRRGVGISIPGARPGRVTR